MLYRLCALLLCLCSGLAGCVDAPPKEVDDPRPSVLVMGDSMLAWNSNSDQGVADHLENRLGMNVIDRSVTGAFVIYNLPISGSLGLRVHSQYMGHSWDWVVMNGGGNDLWLGCGCGECTARLDKMISADGSSGVIPDFVQALRRTGTRVIYPGYLRTPGFNSPVEQCNRIGEVFEARLTRMAARDPGVWFLSNKDLVPNGDKSFHWADRIHPSPKGSATIAARISALIVDHSES